MAARTIDGPEQQYLTSKEAALFLGVSVPTFKRIVGMTKGSPLLLPGVTEWFRPAAIDGVTRWHWMDVVCLSRILERRVPAEKLPAPAPDDETDDDQ